MKKNRTLQFIAIVLVSMAVFISYSLYSNGGINTTSTHGTKTYKSLSDVQSDTMLDLSIPSGIDTSQIIEIRSTLGQLVEARAEHYILKAAKFIDKNADTLGLYEASEVDNKYDISNSDITFFRYRSGYKGYENCTIINWCNTTTSIGIMLDEIYTEDEIIDMLELNESNMKSCTASESEIIDIPIEWNQHTIANGKISLSLPSLESSLEALDFEGYTIIFLNKNRCLVVVYSDYSIDTNVFGGQGQIDIDEHTRLNYLLENEFELDTEEYRDYNVILNNIQEIAESITRN